MRNNKNYAIQIEEAYKKVNNGEWGWRALRLMSRRSSHFFISGNNPIAKVGRKQIRKILFTFPPIVTRIPGVDAGQNGQGDAWTGA